MAPKKRAPDFQPDISFLLDPGPTETISATIPKNILEQARQSIGNRGLSAFIASAMRRELIRMNRRKYIEMVEAESGPISEEIREEARRNLAL